MGRVANSHHAAMGARDPFPHVKMATGKLSMDSVLVCPYLRTKNRTCAHTHYSPRVGTAICICYPQISHARGHTRYPRSASWAKPTKAVATFDEWRHSTGRRRVVM
jgi:hypothetical protein